MSDDKGLKARVTSQGEEAIGKLAQELLENPVVSRRAVGGVRDARARDARPGGRDGRAQPPLGQRPRAADAPRAERLAAPGGDRGRARPARAAARARLGDVQALEERLARIEAALERLEGADAAGVSGTERPARLARRSPSVRRRSARAASSPSRCSASRSASGSIRPPLGEQQVGDEQQRRGREAAPRGQREQRRGLHLDRERAVGEPALLGVPAAVVEEVGRDDRTRRRAAVRRRPSSRASSSGVGGDPRRRRRARGWSRRRRSPRSTISSRRAPSAAPSAAAGADAQERPGAELDQLGDHDRGARAAHAGALDRQRRAVGGGRPCSPTGRGCG